MITSGTMDCWKNGMVERLKVKGERIKVGGLRQAKRGDFPKPLLYDIMIETER